MNLKSLGIAKHLETVGHGDMFDLGMAEIGRIETWFGAIGGPLRARTLAALVNDDADDDLIEACAASIAHLEQWPALLRELLLYAELSAPVIAVAHHALRSRQPDHPLAGEFGLGRSVAMVCDALCDGRQVTFRAAPGPDPARPWLFIDPEDVLTRFSVHPVSVEGSLVSLPVAGLPWLDPAQVACSAFALIA